jgi:hypothetical protein
MSMPRGDHAGDDRAAFGGGDIRRDEQIRNGFGMIDGHRGFLLVVTEIVVLSPVAQAGMGDAVLATARPFSLRRSLQSAICACRPAPTSFCPRSKQLGSAAALR